MASYAFSAYFYLIFWYIGIPNHQESHYQLTQPILYPPSILDKSNMLSSSEQADIVVTVNKAAKASHITIKTFFFIIILNF